MFLILVDFGNKEKVMRSLNQQAATMHLLMRRAAATKTRRAAATSSGDKQQRRAAATSSSDEQRRQLAAAVTSNGDEIPTAEGYEFGGWKSELRTSEVDNRFRVTLLTLGLGIPDCYSVYLIIGSVF